MAKAQDYVILKLELNKDKMREAGLQVTLSNERVVLEVQLKKEKLKESGLYSAMLSSYDDGGSCYPVRPENKIDQLLTLPLSLPTPPTVPCEVMLDYLAVIGTSKQADHIKACLKACSLLDDRRYLEVCVSRLLTSFNSCKGVLDEIADHHLEDILLLLPKDLWPDRFQDSDKLLAKWLRKHYYNLSGDSYVQFTVDNRVYTYLFIHVTGDDDLIYVVSNVTKDRLDKKLYVESTYDNEYKFLYDTLGADCVPRSKKIATLLSSSSSFYSSSSSSSSSKGRGGGEGGKEDSDEQVFNVRDMCWDRNKELRVSELHCKQVAGYKVKEVEQVWYCNSDHGWLYCHKQLGPVLDVVSKVEYHSKGYHSDNTPDKVVREELFKIDGSIEVLVSVGTVDQMTCDKFRPTKSTTTLIPKPNLFDDPLFMAIVTKVKVEYVSNDNHQYDDEYEYYNSGRVYVKDTETAEYIYSDQDQAPLQVVFIKSLETSKRNSGLKAVYYYHSYVTDANGDNTLQQRVKKFVYYNKYNNRDTKLFEEHDNIGIDLRLDLWL